MTMLASARRLVLGALLALAAYPAAAQDQASISGFVRDASTGETLLLANVVLAGTQLGAATNNSGYYTLTGLAPGTYTVLATYIGYQDFREEVTLEPGQALRLDIALRGDDELLDEVVVEAEAEEAEDRNIGVERLDTDVIKRLPAVLEPDVFRSLQLLPGIKAASDFSSGLYIRGGTPDQTLILLDRNVVYNPTHFFGIFSNFNPDAIKDVRLYKGGYPASYGGRLGSVVDVYNKDGNRNEYDGSLSVGLLASRALIEGPFNKGSWMLAVRRSTLEPLLAALRGQDVENIPNGFYFYDLNGKVNFDASDNDRFSLAFYAGADNLDAEFLDDASLNVVYGNRTVSANWTHLFSNRLFSNFTLTASRYFSEPVFEAGGTPFERENGVTDYSVKGDFEYIPNERHAFEVGFWGGRFRSRLRDLFDERETFKTTIEAAYGSAYVQETFRPTPLWQLQAGLRASYFAEGDYVRLEPRVSVEHRPFARMRLQAGYGRYYQFLSLITNEALAGFDIWVATDEGVPPSFGDQFVFGVKTSLTDRINLDVETYYRTMQDLFLLDPGLQDAAGVPYRDLFIYGEGYAYGLEVLLEKTAGRVSGFLGYTLGRTQRRYPTAAFEDLQRFYSPKYDRTHDLKTVLNVGLGRRWRATGVFTFATGQAYSVPTGQFKLQDVPFQTFTLNVTQTDFGGGRLADYHRLDLGVSRIGRFFGFADYELQFQVINAYGRENVWFIFTDFNDDNTVTLEEVPQIPVPLPNIALTLRF